MYGMNLFLDFDGNLTDHGQRHFVSTVNDHCFIALSTTHLLDTAYGSFLRANNPHGKATARRHMFAAVEQIVLYAGRISAVISPIGKKKLSPEAQTLREARAKFMASTFADINCNVLHDRLVRNKVEHYDERVEEAVVAAEPGAGWVEDMLGDKNAIVFTDSPPPIWQRRFDYETGEFEVLGEILDLKLLLTDIQRVRDVSTQWLVANGDI